MSVGTAAAEVTEQLAPYLKHRTTGRPWVVLKMAASLDARTAAPDGTSRWITGEEARRDVHRLRARSDAILVGAGTVRADDPELTVRLGDGPAPTQPLRVVLGAAPPGAKVLPALELSGALGDVLTELGQRGVLQLLVEGGASVAHDFHAAGLVDRYVLYLAPVLFGGDDGQTDFRGAGSWHNWRRLARKVGFRGATGRGSASGGCGLMGFSEVKEAIDAIGRLGMVVVVDDEDRENEGDLVMAAEAATPENIAFFLAHTSGVICVPLLPERADALELPLMVTANTEAQRTAFTVSVDFRHGTTTGISATDRAVDHRRPDRSGHPAHAT